MTTKSHTELAALAEYFDNFANDLERGMTCWCSSTAARAAAAAARNLAALESPERVTKEMWKNAAENALELAQSLTTTPPERVQVARPTGPTTEQVYAIRDSLEAAAIQIWGIHFVYSSADERVFSQGFRSGWGAREHPTTLDRLSPTPPTAPAQAPQAATAGASKSKDLTDEDMDAVVTAIADLNRGEFGYHAFCDRIIEIAALRASTPERVPLKDGGAA